MAKNKRHQLEEAASFVDSEANESFINELQMTIAEAVEKAKGETMAGIESQVEFSQEEKSLLSEILTNIFKKQLDIRYTVKRTLLGGFKISVGDWKLDATLSYQLNLMTKTLSKTSL